MSYDDGDFYHLTVSQMFKDNVWKLREQLTLYGCCLKWHVFVQWSEGNKQRDWLSSFENKRVWVVKLVNAPVCTMNGCSFSNSQPLDNKAVSRTHRCTSPKVCHAVSKATAPFKYYITQKKEKKISHEISAHQTEVWYKYEKGALIKN